MKQSIIALALVGAALLAYPTQARAHGNYNIQIASTSPGGGGLRIVYKDEADYADLGPNLSGVTRLSFDTTLGGFSIYTGLEPAIELLAADDVPNSLYVLSSGTDVSLEITAIDADISLVVNATLLTSVGGAAALGTESPTFDHVHPQYQLALPLAEGAFGEGSFSFKLKTLTGPYSESPVYTMQVTNGPIAPLDYDATDYDAKGVACQKKVGAQVGAFINKKFGALRKCLDKLAAYTAKSDLTTAPPDLARAHAAAEKACANASGTNPDSSTMLGKIAAAQAAAFAAIQSKCGPPTPSADPYLSDDDITQQLGFAGCRVEALVAGAYGGAREQLAGFTARASQGGQTLDTYFPCLVPTAAE